MRSTLLLIAAFVTVMLASFIWFVATWDKDAEAPIGSLNAVQGDVS